MTENEKWHVIYDDEEIIEMLQNEGETPESSSGLSTKEIEELYSDMYIRDDSNDPECTMALLKYIGLIAGITIGAIGIHHCCRLVIKKIKTKINERKSKKEES